MLSPGALLKPEAWQKGRGKSLEEPNEADDREWL